MHQIIGISIALFIAPLLVPSWKYLIGFGVAFNSICFGFYFYHQHLIASDPTLGGPGDALGILFVILFCLSFSAGITAKLIYLVIRSYINKKRTLEITNA
ncbi:hypothetical protein [Pseudomonas leptonychotis]|uniref:Uncharacterized protein n=1 Tax=Pseudomonas leptonychotis TaxID=2448482 RepID=A0A4V4R7J0_9PSED|nr:hypothetical protein [Pseudomonas leptonychotis]TIH06224.1 hypothetical protein D8779_20470 [Pseudomonas leptonychotis]